MPRILCIETATHLCSVALADGARILAVRDEEDRGRFIHAERLNVFIDAAMKEAGWTFKDLEAVAVGIGPGSYTGLRIGLSAAKGLCYALGIPIMGIGTLDTLKSALQASGLALHAGDVLWPMVDARRMEVFTQRYDASGEALDEPRSKVLDAAWLASLPADRRTIVFGDGADKAVELWKSRPEIAHVPGIGAWARAMAPSAMARFAAGRFDDLAYLVPMYGKAANVGKPRSITSPQGS